MDVEAHWKLRARLCKAKRLVWCQCGACHFTAAAPRLRFARPMANFYPQACLEEIFAIEKHYFYVRWFADPQRPRAALNVEVTQTELDYLVACVSDGCMRSALNAVRAREARRKHFASRGGRVREICA